MSVNSEKAAVEAAIIAVLGSVITVTSPDTVAAHVGGYVLPEPNSVWPYIVWTRLEYLTDALYAGAGYESGNPDDRPNLYSMKYFSQLATQTTQTVRAVMDTHDDFLEALIVYFQNQTHAHLPDLSGIRQVDFAGVPILCVANPEGPYELMAGSATLVSEIQLPVKQLTRAPS